MEKEQTGASFGPGSRADAPSPQAVSAFGEYPSRGPSYNGRSSPDYQDGFNTANERADERIRKLEAEVVRLTQRLINGPANMQECAEFCRVAREDGDGKPCLDCHPENFHF